MIFLTKINRIILLSIFMLSLSACEALGPPPEPFHTARASGYYVSKPIQCVIYARQHSAVQLRGDAYTWWGQASPRYAKGNTPTPGSVLVLKNTKKMRSGHVAVVKQVLGPRLIDVTHSNWGSSKKSRSIVYETMLVEDISPANNWTSVKFWNFEKNVFGFPYAAFGFIYPSSGV